MMSNSPLKLYPKSFRLWWERHKTSKAFDSELISLALYGALTETAYHGWNAGTEHKPDEKSKVSFEQIQTIVADKLGFRVDRIGLKTEFISDLKADSLDQVELIMAFEDHYNIEITDDETAKIKTVKDALILLKKKVD